MSGQEHVFVFVVCGAREHIDTLHYSLEALRKVTGRRIIVVTDRNRNEIPIVHDDMVEVNTPESFDHHQASIYLKTGLHRLLPVGPLYCYLDTDVVALGPEVDQVFAQYHSPITFGADHCLMDQFSPAAVRCGCNERFQDWQDELTTLLANYQEVPRKEEDRVKKQRLVKRLTEMKKDRIGYALTSIRFNLARKRFKLDDDTFYDRRNKVWIDASDNPILYEWGEKSTVQQIEASSGYRLVDETWYMNGEPVFDCRCDHLRQHISTDLGITIDPANWQHWNGGVFLFDSESFPFLDDWHEITLWAFNQPDWKTRDQGSLIATVWKHGLQDHPTLAPEYNYIADHGKEEVIHRGDLLFYDTDKNREVRPHLIHIYHHWADHGWSVWNDVEKRTGITIDPDAYTVNALWIGSRLSNLELLTIRSFMAHGHRFRLWAYDNIETPLPEGIILADAGRIIPKHQVFAYRNSNSFGHGKGSYAGFSDVFRYKLLYEIGGWWTDMDITCLRPLYTDKAYFFRPHHELPVVGNLMKCPKGSELMRRCYEEGKATIDEHNTDWHAPIEILNRNIAALGLEPYISISICNSDRWEETSAYVLSKAHPPDHWAFIHWQNEEWRSRGLDKDAVVNGSFLALLMLQHGLEVKSPTLLDRWSAMVGNAKVRNIVRLLR